VPADPSEILAAFGSWNEEFSALATAMCEHGAYKWGLFGREPLTSWRRGRVLLVGDAAHPMLPFLGQGAALAIEDGVVLGRAFAHSANFDSALVNYEKARFPRAMTTVARANDQGLRLHGYVTAGADAPVPRDDFAEYAYDAGAVTFPDQLA
jgi:salicylate hydroxylase